MKRVDILIYAHDGRGLGHASRSIAIGCALRRCYPELAVIFISGAAASSELIGDAPLDWCKLPSYKTVIKDGKSSGVRGLSGLADDELGSLRAQHIRAMVEIYRPRLVLADHSPQGKHRELIPALESRAGAEASWVLGVRGVVGAVSQTLSSLPADLFKSHYRALLWYGSSHVLGSEHICQLAELYACSPYECGYVSRMAEQCSVPTPRAGGGVISIPWLGPGTTRFFHTLCAFLAEDRSRSWQIFIDEVPAELADTLANLPHCQVHVPSRHYMQALAHAELAIIYGGYNSLVDVLTARVPALVCLRDMRDREQQIHLAALERELSGAIISCCEDIEAGALCKKLQQLTDASVPELALDGAERAAARLYTLLNEE